MTKSKKTSIAKHVKDLTLEWNNYSFMLQENNCQRDLHVFWPDPWPPPPPPWVDKAEKQHLQCSMGVSSLLSIGFKFHDMVDDISQPYTWRHRRAYGQKKKVDLPACPPPPPTGGICHKRSPPQQSNPLHDILGIKTTLSVAFYDTYWNTEDNIPFNPPGQLNKQNTQASVVHHCQQTVRTSLMSKIFSEQKPKSLNAISTTNTLYKDNSTLLNRLYGGCLWR